MTREEAIERIKEIKDRAWGYHIDKEVIGIPYSEFLEIMDSALSALRPVSREKVEKVWRGGWETIPEKGFLDTMGRQVYYLHCPRCGFQWRERGHAKYFSFCPSCGAPMTDDAVDMVMERLEALSSLHAQNLCNQITQNSTICQSGEERGRHAQKTSGV